MKSEILKKAKDAEVFDSQSDIMEDFSHIEGGTECLDNDNIRQICPMLIICKGLYFTNENHRKISSDIIYL